MLSEQPDDIGRARRSFAKELRHTAHVRSPAVVDAFATVPRERFARAGPMANNEPHAWSGLLDHRRR